MPNEVAGQLETIHYTEEDEVSESSPPRSKKRKLDTPKWKTSHIPPKNTNGLSFDAAQAKKFLAHKHPEIIGVSEWSVFKKCSRISLITWLLKQIGLLNRVIIIASKLRKMR